MNIRLILILMACCHLAVAQVKPPKGSGQSTGKEDRSRPAPPKVSIEPVSADPVEAPSAPVAAGKKAHPDAYSPNELDQPPEFPGGITAWNQYISDNLQYPESAKEEEIQGRFVASVVVEADGSLSEIQIVRSISADCNAEAIRLIRASPKWISGQKDGKAVRASYNLIVTFRL